MSDKEFAHSRILAGARPADIEKETDGRIKADTVRKWVKRLNWTRQDKKQDNKTGQLNRTNATNKKTRKIKDSVLNPSQTPKTRSFIKTNTTRHESRLGNQNAKGNKGGNGAPQGNKYNLRHGVFSLINPESLSVEEYEYFQSKRDIDVIAELESQVLLCDIKIARHLAKLKELENLPGIAARVIERGRTVDGTERGRESNYTVNESEKEMHTTFDYIAKINADIDRVAKLRGKCLKDIEELKLIRMKLNDVTMQSEQRMQLSKLFAEEINGSEYDPEKTFNEQASAPDDS